MKKLCIFVVFLFVSCAGLRYPTILDEIGGEDDYPEANALVVFDSTDIHLNWDGTNRIRTHRCGKVFNALGRKEFGEVTLSYITLYDTVKIIAARVISPDKKIVKVPEDNITDMPMPAWEGSKFYIPNLRLVKITFPGLEDGSAIELVYESICHNSPFDSTFDWWELFEFTEPIKEKVLRLFLPEGMDLKYKVENGKITHYQVVSDDKTLHIWKKEDIPKIVMEPSMPPLPTVGTKLLFTCTESWKDYSRWYYEVSEPRLKPDSALTAKVMELIKKAPSKDDTIRALYEFVNKEIRYVETELIGKRGGFEPAEVSFTFKNKYGVCRDKAALLVSMLRTAGIGDSYIVLTNPLLPNMDPELACASQFNHAIVAIETDVGYFYLDPTAEGSVEYLTPFEDDKPVLVSTKQGDDLSKTPARPPEVNLINMQVSEVLKKDRTLNQLMTIKASGFIDNQFRQMCQMLPKEQIKLIFLKGMKESYPKATIDSFNTTDPKDFTTPMEFTVYVTVPDYALKIGREWYLTSGKRSSLSVGAQGMWNLEERNYPLYLWIKMATKARARLLFPKHLKVKSLPEPYQYEDSNVFMKTSYSKKRNTINSEFEMIFKDPLISPDNYQKIKKAMKELEEHQSQEIILVEK